MDDVERRLAEADEAIAEYRNPSTLYTPELADTFCELIASGLNVAQALRYPGMPKHKTSIYQWLFKHPEFAEKYRLAQQARTEAYVEEMIEIADDCTDDIGMGPNGPIIKTSSIRRAALRIDTRKWNVSKLNAMKYGDKITQEHTGPGGASLGNTVINVQLLPTGTVIPKERDEDEIEVPTSEE